MLNQINDIILKITGVCFIKPYPKHSIRYCKNYFKSRPIKVIEIGTFKGVNAKDILDNLNVKKIYLIDPYDEYIGEDNFIRKNITKDNLIKSKKHAYKKLKKYYQEGKIKWIEKYSDNAKKDVSEVDYIYIDGEHTYKQLTKDLENYYPKLKEFGIIAGHDIHIIGVLNAVQDFTRNKNLYFQVAGQDWWFIKNIPNSDERGLK